MTVLTIGRISGDLAVTNVSSFEVNGDYARVQGRLSAEDPEVALWQREMFRGLSFESDESIVPVTYDSDPLADGFYRVLDVNVNPERFPIGAFPFSMDLQRIASSSSPAFESVLLGALRVNGHGIVVGSTVPWVAVPDDAHYFDPGPLPISPSVNRTSADGVVTIHFDGTNQRLNDAIARWSISPALAYVGAAKLEVGTTLRTVVGRQIQNLTANWRLSNGLLRITPVSGSSDLDISCYDGTQWDNAVRFDFGYDVATFFAGFSPYVAVTVLRNSPEAVSIRLSAPPAFKIGNLHTVDLTLRRGARMVEVCMSSDVGFKGRIKMTTPAAATALTGGIRGTSNNASGNRFVLSTPLSFTSDMVNGGLYNTSASTSVPLAVGFEVGGSGATETIETAQSLIYQYHAALSERQTLRSR